MKNFAIILNTSGPLFGGAEKRYTALFQYLYSQYPGNVYYLVSNDFYINIKQFSPDCNFENVIVLKNFKLNFLPIRKLKLKRSEIVENSLTDKTINHDPELELSSSTKIFRYFRSFIKQYYLFRQIDRIRKEKNIKIFIGVFSGILPLYFYLNKKYRKTGTIFSDMDSWFSNINDGDSNFWYKKYDSFNYGLEKSDKIDFLSPFILEGLLKRNVNLNKASINFTPCSFSDYSKCIPDIKKEFLVSYAARIFPDKNPLLFLEAAKIIIGKYPFVKFRLMGAGESYLEKEINQFILQNKLKDNVSFGFHPNPPEVFAESSVFVSIQSSNNYPSQSVLEAMACGNAIIASDVGDTRMFINENSGFLIPLEVISLVNALEHLINNREIALKLCKNAREYVLRNHTVEKCANYYLDLIEQTCVEIENKN